MTAVKITLSEVNACKDVYKRDKLVAEESEVDETALSKPNTPLDPPSFLRLDRLLDLNHARYAEEVA